MILNNREGIASYACRENKTTKAWLEFVNFSAKKTLSKLTLVHMNNKSDKNAVKNRALNELLWVLGSLVEYDNVV